MSQGLTVPDQSNNVVNMNRLALLLLAPLAACSMPAVQQVTSQPTPAPTAPAVVVVGDSITAAAQPALTEALSGAVVDGNPGRGPDASPFGGSTLRDALKERIRGVPAGGWLVVQDDGGEEITAEFVQWVTDTLPDDRGLVWVSPSNWTRPDLPASRATVVAGIAAQPKHRFVDWRAQVVKDPDLTPDGLHPDARGATVLAGLIAEAVR